NRKGGNSIVKALLNNGADIDNITNKLKKSPLIFSVLHCNSTSKISTVKLLIHRGADVNKVDGYERSALVYAIQNSYDVTKLLLDNGADINVTDAWGLSILHGINVNNKNIIDIIKLLNK